MKNIEVGTKFENGAGERFEITYVSPAKFSLKARNLRNELLYSFLWSDKFDAFVMETNPKVQLGDLIT